MSAKRSKSPKTLIHRKINDSDRKKAYATLVRQSEVEEFLSKLISEADGSPEKLALLLQVAYKSAKALAEMCEQHPHYAKTLSRRMKVWPMLLSPASDIKDSIRALTELEVAKDFGTPIVFSKFKRNKTVARNWATSAIESIESYRKKASHKRAVTFEELSNQLFLNPAFFIDETGFESLMDKPLEPMPQDARAVPPTTYAEHQLRLEKFTDWTEKMQRDCAVLPDLTKATIKTWMPVIKNWVTFMTHGHPENNINLGKQGLYRKNHYQSEVIARRIGNKIDRSVASNIRDGIFTKIEQAVKAIVRDSKSFPETIKQ